jgi:neutral ceramidase
MHPFGKVGLAIAAVLTLLPIRGSAGDRGGLEAGAARVDVTPDAEIILRPFTSIHDQLYARAIYLENGPDRAVLLNADVGAISTAIAELASAEISRELKIPAANILISATHDHSAIFGGPRPAGCAESGIERGSTA